MKSCRHALSVALALALLAAASPLWASTASQYAAIRARYRPTRADDLRLIEENLEQFQGRCFEVSGLISGRMQSGERDVVLLKAAGGGTAALAVSNEAPQMAMGSRVRAIVRPPESRLDLTYSLAAIAWEQEVAAREPKPVSVVAPPRENWTEPSRGAHLRSSSEVIPAYASMIRRLNKRIKPGEAQAIAHAIIEFSARNGLDARLVMAVIAVESNFNASATSRAGAMGLGQLMPATARGMGVGNPYDYRQNLDGAVRLIRGHLLNNSGDVGLALASYNAGAGAVKRYGGVPPYAETRNYIRKVVSLFLAFAPEYANLRR